MVFNANCYVWFGCESALIKKINQIVTFNRALQSKDCFSLFLNEVTHAVSKWSERKIPIRMENCQG